MTHRGTTTVAASVWALAVTLVAVTLVLIVWSRGVRLPAGFDTAGTANTLRYLLPATMGAVLAVRRPGNPIGWVLLVMASATPPSRSLPGTPPPPCSSPTTRCPAGGGSPGPATGSGRRP
jgi:hypothetical protein